MFIDHNGRTVLNGSALGKEFSANAIGAWFADFSGNENLQPVTSVPVRVNQHQVMQPAHDERQPYTVKRYPDGDSPVGSLLSALTPEQYEANEPIPKKRKKKKRRYGRQV